MEEHKYRDISNSEFNKIEIMSVKARKDYYKFARSAQIFRLKVQNFLDRFQEYIYFAVN